MPTLSDHIQQIHGREMVRRFLIRSGAGLLRPGARKSGGRRGEHLSVFSKLLVLFQWEVYGRLQFRFSVQLHWPVSSKFRGSTPSFVLSYVFMI